MIWALSAAFLFLGSVAGEGNVTDYAPKTNVECPDTTTNPLIRVFTPQTQSLHPQEVEYINSRASTVLPDAWKAWLGDGSAISYNISSFGGNFSKIGIAISGGGYRAAQFGAGVLSGLDARNESAKAAGTGGLLQVSSYISALSGLCLLHPTRAALTCSFTGGSWLTGSLLFNEFPTIRDLVYGDGKELAGWLLDIPLANPGGVDLFNDENQKYFGSLLWSVTSKADKGM